MFSIYPQSHDIISQIEQMWDSRVRTYLGERYDAGKNVFDMDFSMKLKERASLLDFKEYATWRQTGACCCCVCISGCVCA